MSETLDNKESIIKAIKADCTDGFFERSDAVIMITDFQNKEVFEIQNTGIAQTEY